MRPRVTFAGGTLLLLLLYFMVPTTIKAQEPAAFTNPSHYFDFSKVVSAGSTDFVVDQVTKNPNNAFSFEGTIY